MSQIAEEIFTEATFRDNFSVLFVSWFVSEVFGLR